MAAGRAMRLATVLGIAASITTPLAGARPAHVRPVEECAADPAFRAVRTSFVDAVRRHDADAVARLASDDVILDDPGVQTGPAALRAMLTGAEASNLWEMLQVVTNGGCASDRDGRVMPSLTWQLQPKQEIAIGGAPLFATPATAAAVLGTAAWEVVVASLSGSDSNFRHVRLGNGRRGWLRQNSIYSAYSPYAEFEKRGGRWRLTTLLLAPAD